jgi:uncharacterized membrane protein YbhN (UPF0104 family)
LTVVIVAAVLGAKTVRRKFSRLSAALRNFDQARTSVRGLIQVLAFYVLMAGLNGLTFWQVVRATPGGDHCPVSVILAANSIAWVIGLFALSAPGGLVVREASLVVLLSGWLPAEQAVTVALAWRAVQVGAEIADYMLVALSGASWSDPRKVADGCHLDQPVMPCPE